MASPLPIFLASNSLRRAGTYDQTPIPEFGETASTFADGRRIEGHPGVVYTTTAPIDAFVLNIAFDEGLYFLTPKGQKEDNMTTIQYRYRIAGTDFVDIWGTFDVVGGSDQYGALCHSPRRPGPGGL